MLGVIYYLCFYLVCKFKLIIALRCFLLRTVNYQSLTSVRFELLWNGGGLLLVIRLGRRVEFDVILWGVACAAVALHFYAFSFYPSLRETNLDLLA